MQYLATINVPGYLPMDDDPPTFDTPREAWEYLLGERRDSEDHAIEVSDTDAGYSATLNQIERAVEGDEDYVDHDGTGSINGPTPGYDGDHDLGLAYTVTKVTD